MDRFNRDQPPLPKPYAFVPIPSAELKPKHPIGHGDYKSDLLTGTITGTLTALSPIHVASGAIELTGKQPSLVKAHFRCGDMPTIPGSSLKGAIRSIVEAISNPPSCLRVSQAGFDDIPSNVRRCSKKEKLCLTCRMFGAMGYLGQVHFSDAVAQQGKTEFIQLPSFFRPRPRERVYYNSGKIAGRKFYMHGRDGKTAPGNVPTEVCPVETTFSLRVDFENLSDAQIALLLCALGQGDPPLIPKLGGGKPACCGSIKITNVALATVSAAESATEFDLETIQQDLASLSGATQLIDQNSLKRLAEILTYPGERVCPDRNY